MLYSTHTRKHAHTHTRTHVVLFASRCSIEDGKSRATSRQTGEEYVPVYPHDVLGGLRSPLRVIYLPGENRTQAAKEFLPATPAQLDSPGQGQTLVGPNSNWKKLDILARRTNWHLQLSFLW